MTPESSCNLVDKLPGTCWCNRGSRRAEHTEQTRLEQNSTEIFFRCQALYGADGYLKLILITRVTLNFDGTENRRHDFLAWVTLVTGEDPLL